MLKGRKKPNPVDLAIINRGITQTKMQLEFLVLNPPSPTNLISKKTYQIMIDDRLDRLNSQLKTRDDIQNGTYTPPGKSPREITRDRIRKIQSPKNYAHKERY